MTVISSLGATVPVTVSPLVLSLWYPQSDPSKFVCEFGNHLLKKPRLVIRYLIFCMSASEFTVFVYRHGLHDPLKSFGTFSLPNQTSVAANLKVDASVHWIWDFCVFVGGVIKMRTYTEMRISTSILFETSRGFQLFHLWLVFFPLSL